MFAFPLYGENWEKEYKVPGMKGVCLWSEHVGDDFCIFQEEPDSAKFRQLRVLL